MTKSNIKSNLYYEISGCENGPWLILLHGLSGSSKSWKPQINAFKDHFHILALDLIGHGNSPGLEMKKYCGSMMANQIRLLMDKLNIDKAHFLGISLGTIVEQYFAGLFPERVISLIYASPVTKPNHFTTFFNNFIDKVVLKLVSKNTYAKIASHLMLPGKAHEKSRYFFIRETMRMKDIEFKKWWKLVLQSTHKDYIPNSDIPALIFAGKKDRCFYGDAVLLTNQYTNNTFHVFEDEGHVFIFKKQKEFNDKVIEFIENIK